MKLSLPDISTWLLPRAMSSRELSVHGGGRGEDHWAKKPGCIYNSSSSFLLPNRPLLMAPAEDNTWPLMTRSNFHQLCSSKSFSTCLCFLRSSRCFSFVLNFILPSALSLHARFTAKMFLWITGCHHPRALAPPCRTLVHCDTASSWQSIDAHIPFPVAQDSRSSEWLSSPQAGEGRDLEGMEVS